MCKIDWVFELAEMNKRQMEQWESLCAKIDSEKIEILNILKWLYENGPTTYHSKDCKIPQVLEIKKLIEQQGE